MAKKVETIIETTLYPTEFHRLVGIPKYTLTKYKDQFQWADPIPGCKPKLIFNDFNKAQAASLINRKGRPGRPKKLS